MFSLPKLYKVFFHLAFFLARAAPGLWPARQMQTAIACLFLVFFIFSSWRKKRKVPPPLALLQSSHQSAASSFPPWASLIFCPFFLASSPPCLCSSRGKRQAQSPSPRARQEGTALHLKVQVISPWHFQLQDKFFPSLASIRLCLTAVRARCEAIRASNPTVPVIKQHQLRQRSRRIRPCPLHPALCYFHRHSSHCHKYYGVS